MLTIIVKDSGEIIGHIDTLMKMACLKTLPLIYHHRARKTLKHLSILVQVQLKVAIQVISATTIIHNLQHVQEDQINLDGHLYLINSKIEKVINNL